MAHEIIGGQFALADGTALPLSKAIRAGDFLYLSGQLGLDAEGKLADGIESQTAACLENIRTLLAQANANMSNVVKATVWLTDLANFKAFNQVYAGVFADQPPTRSTVCSGLALPGALVEIEVIAYLGK